MHRPARNRLRLSLATLLLVSMAAAGAAAFSDEEEPRLGEIVIEGNTRTSETLIRRELGLTSGQIFTFDDMDLVWDHLEDVGFFAFVDMEYDDTDPEHVILRVIVEEDVTLSYGPLVRYDRRYKYELGGMLEERNLGGRGHILEAELSVIYRQRGKLAWRDPWTFGVRGLQLSAMVEAEQGDFVFRPTRQKRLDAGLELRWQFHGPFYALGGATYGSFNQRDDYVWPLPDRGDGPEPVTTYEGGTSTHIVTRGALGLDTRDNPYYPAHGVVLEGDVRYWSSNDFDGYLETSADARVFIPLPIKEHVLAARAWGRLVDDPAQLDNVLYFGGPETVRGYRFGGREGDEGWLMSVEYRLPLFIMPISPRGELVGAGLHAFGDAGDAWYEGAEAGRPMQSWGAGVHLNLDTLQLRFEAARTKEGDWVFEFMDRFNF